MVAVVIGNAAFVREPAVFLILPFLAALFLALTLAIRALAQGDQAKALWLATAGNWAVAVVVTVLFAFLWPVMVLTSLMPLVLGMPHLSRDRLVPFMIGAATTGVLICAIGLLLDDDSIIEDIDEVIEFIVVVGGLLAQASVLGLLVWQGNQLQREALDEALRLNDELTESRVRLVEAGDKERSRIERDLHDGAQQRLSAMGVRLRLHHSQNEVADRDFIEDLITDLNETTTELRELAHGVYPPLLEQRGLVPAITAVTRRIATPIELDLDDIGRFNRGTESALYFVCREALTNAQKHCPDSNISVSLELADGGGPELIIKDSGPGFAEEHQARGRGMLNMKDRLAAVGGTLTIDSASDGTTVVASVPASAAHDVSGHHR